MSTTPSNSAFPDDSIVIVHSAGNQYRCLIVNQKELNIVDALEVEDEEALATLLKERSPQKVISILPGTATICRTSILPDIEDDQLQEALRLQAEARLLGSTPSHRRAVAPLECGEGESSRIGLIIAWPEEANVEIPEILHDASFISETGAIAALFGGCRPNSPILVANKTDGSVSLAITCPQGIAFRSTRENSTTSELFLKGTLRAVEETAILHNHSKAYTKSLIETLQHTLSQHSEMQPCIIIPDEVRLCATSRLRGIQDHDSWWNKWGLAVGAAIASIGTLAPLATMRAHAPKFNPSKLEQFQEYISKPSTAVRFGIASVLLLAVGPVLFSGFRLALLEFLNPNIESQYEEVISARKKQVVYTELTKSAWPMSKLIGDALNCAPAGVEIDSLRLDVGEPMTIRGRVMDADGHTAAELIALMEEKLQSYRVFRDVKFSYEPAETYGDRKFSISAVIMNPLRRPRYAKEDDFGIWTLAMRRDGILPGEGEDTSYEESYIEDETGTSILGSADVGSIPSPAVPPHAGDTVERSARSSTRLRDSSSDAGSRSSNRAGESSNARLPEPLTAAQINVMTLSEAKIALSDVSKGLSRVGSNTEAKVRLRNEMRMLLDRMKAVRK